MREAIDLLKYGLEAVEVGAPRTHQNLTWFPLAGSAGEESPPAYIVLEDALETGGFEVNEVSDSGSVPELSVRNDLDTSVLMFDGDELRGAKQNRVLNVTVLVPRKSRIKVPVSCVEQGRWHYSARHFHSSGETLYARARSTKSSQINASLRGGTRNSDQGEIWSSIEAKQTRMGAFSNTGAVDALYGTYRERLAAYESAFEAGGGERGGVFAIDGQIVGLELFDTPAMFARRLPRLVRSYALDAIETAGKTGGTPDVGAVRAFIDSIRSALMVGYPGVGIGTEVRIESPVIAGGALVESGSVVHACAFAVVA